MDAKLTDQMNEKIQMAMAHLKTELSMVRTGRASLGLFEAIVVDYYGTPTPLRQVASLATPEARLVTIQPWDVSQIAQIEKAIQASKLDVTPTNDGKIIRIMMPLLTEEKRKELVKVVKKRGEESKVSIRNIRRVMNDEIKALQKEGTLSEDMARKNQDEVQKIIDRVIVDVDEVVRKKEEEILHV